MDNAYTDYLRAPRDQDAQILRTICVNPEERLIFFKPGRCAGKAIYNNYLKRHMSGWVTFQGANVSRKDRETFKDWLVDITDNEFSTYKRAIFVRNPFTRLISAWNVLYRNQHKMKFSYFVKTYCTNAHLPADKLHFSQYWRILSMTTTLRLPQVYDNLFIGKVENLRDDMNRLCDYFEIKQPDASVKAFNTKPEKDYSKEYTPELRAIVTNYYRADLDMFNYEF